MKKIFTLFSCLVAFIITANGQGLASKINNANGKINNTDTAVNGTSNAINSASGTLGNAGNALSNLSNTLGGMIKKKSKQGTSKRANAADTALQAKQADNANTRIIIRVAGADYVSLKKLKESLKAVVGVQSITINYEAAGSTLSVSSDKKADDLWDGVSNTIAVHYNIISMNDNAINVTYKQ